MKLSTGLLVMGVAVVVGLAVGPAAAEVIVLQNSDSTVFSPLTQVRAAGNGSTTPNAGTYNVEYLNVGNIITADLSSIDMTGKFVSSATYETFNRPSDTTFKPSGADGLIPFSLSVGAIAETWTGVAAHSNTRNLWSFRTAPGVDFWASGIPWAGQALERPMLIANPALSEWNSVDITDIMQGWLDGSLDNNGLGIGMYDSTYNANAPAPVNNFYGAWGIAAGQFAGSLQASTPRFTIVLDVIPEPATMGLLLSGGLLTLLRRPRHQAGLVS